MISLNCGTKKTFEEEDLETALLRSGRLDRKIKFPAPARARIMQIHSRKMNVSPDVNFDKLARSTGETDPSLVIAFLLMGIGDTKLRWDFMQPLGPLGNFF